MELTLDKVPLGVSCVNVNGIGHSASQFGMCRWFSSEPFPVTTSPRSEIGIKKH